MSNFMTIRSVRAEFFHADLRTDGRTDMTNLIVAFRNFTNAPKNIHLVFQITQLQIIHYSYIFY